MYFKITHPVLLSAYQLQDFGKNENDMHPFFETREIVKISVTVIQTYFSVSVFCNAGNINYCVLLSANGSFF